MAAIHFFTEDIKFNLPEKQKHKQWIKDIIKSEEANLSEINYIFCSDKYLHQLNLQFLSHDTYTDIITFDRSEHENEISGDIYISVDRIQDNATNYNQEFFQELRRVIIHGVLHLLGYMDKTEKEKEMMSLKENESLLKWKVPTVPRGTVDTKN